MLRPTKLLTSLALLALAVLPACGLGEPPAAPTLKVGIVAPLSGEYEALGRRVREGVLLAAEVQNQSGGILGYQVQVVLEDSHCDYLAARAAAQEVIDQGVLFIIGAVCADASEGVAQVAEDADVLQISPASVDLDLTLDAEGEVRPLVFRVPSADVDQGVVAAEFALEELGAERAGLLFAEGTDYGSALAEAFRIRFEAGGGEVVSRQAYDQDAEFFYDELEAVRDAEPDVLYAPGYYTVANGLINQARQFGLFEPVIGSDGWDSPNLSLDAVEVAYFTTYYYADDPRYAARAWSQLYEARYLEEPDALATMSYDGARLLFSAIQEAGVPDPYLVAQALEQIRFEGVGGELSFDASHNPVRPIIMLRVENGRLSLQGEYFARESEGPSLPGTDEPPTD
ncbi:MAG: ABC transporter substrate-binding protein [Anaerolineae bacterium]